ncbi:TPA: hypothetical protein ACGUMO_004376 [Vibrio vulnificus]|uniref:hypothetical protein n=1 Tax=Vibrio TaxID=662 RepID=UPI000BA8EA4D|nr:hypothetical protein [Vibrio cholerae]EGR4199720.1 hypothetical protein [Vibrio cholerae]EGR4280690.1 hypothetical protein [Vibrio cholerae]EKY3318979.1 hypothetical protein [Vibrio cholerae]PAS37756.1 hypothetical protein CGT69_18220 [Vibrio cholerae]PAS46297.1 hypothetical protein CGT68_01470 [Vibrio cholerae]
MEAHITFFNIEKAGYYRFGQAEPVFSNISDLIDKLKVWASDGRSLENTSTFQAVPERDLMRAFYVDAKKHDATGDYVLTLWNEVQNDDGKIYGVRPNQLPGNTEILQTGFDGAAIPGFPSYYWFISKLNLFASIKFDHSIQGKQQLDRYLDGFLCNKSPYRVLDEDDSIVGYTENAKYEAGCDKNYPRFIAKVVKNNQLEAELLANISQIRKFVRKESLLYSSSDDRTVIERMFSSLLVNTPSFMQSREITQEIAFQPSENQLRNIIQNYYENENDSLKNVGFVYSSGKRVMLNGVRVAFKYDLEVVRYNDHVINVENMMAALQIAREDLLAQIENPIQQG